MLELSSAWPLFKSSTCEGTGLQSLQFGAQQAAKKLKLKYVVQQVVQYTLEARIEKYNENYFAHENAKGLLISERNFGVFKPPKK